MNLDKDNGPAMPQRKNNDVGRIWLGLVIMLIGGLFLADNLGFDLVWPLLRHWWALFLLIPAATQLLTAWRHYQRNGQRIDGAVSGPLIGGLACAMVATVFLAGLSFRVWWPLFLMLGGLAVLLPGKGR